MAKILYGRPVSEKIKKSLTQKVREMGEKPSLLIIQVGNRDDSNIYIKNKVTFGEEIGVRVFHKKFDEKINQKEIEEKIYGLVRDDTYRGVIIQLPLPFGLNTENILKMIPNNKDADGLSPGGDGDYLNIITPATARAVMAILDYYEFDILDKKVVVLGKSRLAGEPIALLLSRNGADVRIFDKESNKEEVKLNSKVSDILISATGNPNLITKEYVNENQVVIDVGINRLGEKIVGDVDFDNVSKIVKAITPVPGGVGPLTVACLFENLLEL